MSNRDDTFPYSFYINRRIYIDPQDVMKAMGASAYSATFRSVPPGHAVDLTSTAGSLPNILMWITEYRTAAESLPTGERAHQLIVFPETGRVFVETKQQTLVCDGRFGVNVETEDLVSVRFEPGRRGPGISLDRLSLLHRLAVLIDAPVRRRLAFDLRFDTAVAHQGAVGEMIRAVLSPNLGAAFTTSPATASALSATFLDLVLHSLPHSYSEDLRRPPPRIAPKHIKRAMDYVEDHVHSALTVDDLARVAGVSIRSLQYGFRHFLDVSPADHIRNIRLERARRDILDQQESSLTEIAGRWGFANLARFNARFRVAYGETPASYRRRQQKPGPVQAT